ncbi:MAG TPA: lipoprotein [Beijerinckiaceae bacterium]|nr:lipoprotein [Beijerinckiaceae bacterium]
MNRVLVAAGIAVALAGCTAAQSEGERPLFGRVDCRSIAGNAALEQEFEQAKAICLPRAEAAAVAATANMPRGYGLAGAIVAGIEQGMTRNQIGTSTAVSCMAEQGYLFRTPSAHEQACAAIAAERRAVTSRPVTSRPRPPAPAPAPKPAA